MTTASTGATETARAAKRIRAWSTRPVVLRIASLVIFLLCWEWFGRDHAMVTSYPTAIVAAGVRDFVPVVIPAFTETLKGLSVGFGLSILIGVPVGLLMSGVRTVEVALAPYVSAFYATPRITLIPVLVLWLGISFDLRIGIVVLSAVFPIILNTWLGGKEVSNDLLDVGRAFNSSGIRAYWSIRLRACLPFVFSGLRIGLGRGLMGIVLAEIFTSAGGVGNAIIYDAKYFHIDSMFVMVVLLGLLGLLITEGLGRLERRLVAPWERSTRARKG